VDQNWECGVCLRVPAEQTAKSAPKEKLQKTSTSIIVGSSLLCCCVVKQVERERERKECVEKDAFRKTA
jgi:hypothetical protein